jgi:hypothetical protein
MIPLKSYIKNIWVIPESAFDEIQNWAEQWVQL